MKDENRNRGLVTVVICTLNESRSVGAVINSACKYTDDILVVDGHSRDNTAGIARSLGARVIYDNKKGKDFTREAQRYLPY